MTETLIPDTAMVVSDDITSLLPEGWYVSGYRAEINRGAFREERILSVELAYAERPVEVWLELHAMPDAEWLGRFLVECQGLPKGTRIGAGLRDPLW
jgi:hypothetical protein